MTTLLEYLVLPRQVTDFEAKYLGRMNRIGFGFFALHVPVLAVVAYFNDTGPGLAVLLTLAVMVGPALAYAAFKNPRHISAVYGFTAMLMGGLLVHFGQGHVQIEMHFYFFALIAMLALYGNPVVILVAAVTVTLHHLLLWMYLPASVFNYAAPIWVVAVHAAFVVLESIAGCFIARSFFDNVIRLEKIVQARTTELDGRNQDLHLLLDNVDQGFLTIDRAGAMSQEKSAVVERWLGPSQKGALFTDYVARAAPEFAEAFGFGWEQVLDDVLPLELALGQLPTRFSIGVRHFQVSYTPLLGAQGLEKVLLVISDVTTERERECLEIEQREVLAVFERLSEDRNGFLEFCEEAQEHVAAVESDSCADLLVLKRILHTLKGNSLLFGIRTIADQCHVMETRILEEGSRPSAEQRTALRQRWERLRSNIRALRGDLQPRTIEIDDGEYDAIVSAVRSNEGQLRLLRRVADLKLEPTLKRLGRVAEQAQSIAARLEKGMIRVKIAHNELRLDPLPWAPFWSAFVHVLRNAVDHGFEEAQQREALGKPREGQLELTTRMVEEEFVIEIADDGRGIDWQAVAERAQSRGIAHRTAAELTDALFEDGISTAKQVSEFSGRGIGMGAIRAACLARGGSIGVSSVAGQGTRIEFRFPRSKMASGLGRDSLPVALGTPRPFDDKLGPLTA